MRLVRNANGPGEEFQEEVGRREIDREVQLSQQVLFHPYNLGLRAGVVRHVHEIQNRRGVNLLVLGSNYHGCNAEELHLAPPNLSLGEEPVSEIYSDMECFSLKPEPNVDINQPVDQNDAHVLVDLDLLSHVVRSWVIDVLFIAAPVVDVVRVLKGIEGNFHSWCCKPAAVKPRGFDVGNFQ